LHKPMRKLKIRVRLLCLLASCAIGGGTWLTWAIDPSSATTIGSFAGAGPALPPDIQTGILITIGTCLLLISLIGKFPESPNQ